ncbi:hypothetical protein SAMN05216214_11591 [Atopomonas hussainii]|uniref:Uncharacterized protein n=1 Tax=Atopomonas hussainii TaxID=1429083 RepID=A0A1H7RR03_9GAMM|nr:hypothetical protein SAMN05216214_11591 [Atopomonas hussainii]
MRLTRYAHKTCTTASFVALYAAETGLPPLRSLYLGL